MCMGGGGETEKRFCTHPPYYCAHSSEVGGGGGGGGQVWSLAVLTILSILASKVHKLLTHTICTHNKYIHAHHIDDLYMHTGDRCTKYVKIIMVQIVEQFKCLSG